MDQPPDLIAGDKLQLEYWDSSSKGGCSPRKSLFTHPFKCPFYVSSAFTVKTQAKQLKKNTQQVQFWFQMQKEVEGRWWLLGARFSAAS